MSTAPLPADGIGKPKNAWHDSPTAKGSGAWSSGSSYSDSAYSGASTTTPTASYSPPAYTAPSSPPGSAWSSRQAEPAAPTAAGVGGQPPAAPAAGGGFSAGAGVSGGAAGLAGYASSVTSGWQKNRGAKSKGKQGAAVGRSNKRQAMLTLSRVEPWSVMKFSFVASVVAFIILFVAIAVLYLALSALGVFDSLQHFVSTLTSAKNSLGTNISHWFSASLILGYTAMLGALNVVLITAISTIGSVIYNLIAKTFGGIEVTLRETE